MNFEQINTIDVEEEEAEYFLKLQSINEMHQKSNQLEWHPNEDLYAFLAFDYLVLQYDSH